MCQVYVNSLITAYLFAIERHEKHFWDIRHMSDGFGSAISGLEVTHSMLWKNCAISVFVLLIKF